MKSLHQVENKSQREKKESKRAFFCSERKRKHKYSNKDTHSERKKEKEILSFQEKEKREVFYKERLCSPQEEEAGTAPLIYLVRNILLRLREKMVMFFLRGGFVVMIILRLFFFFFQEKEGVRRSVFERKEMRNEKKGI